MKKILWGGLVLALAAQSFAGVFISEYIEGSGSNKALEIYNNSGGTINLSNYQIKVSFNGGTTVVTRTLVGELVPQGGTYVLANSAASIPAILAAADTLDNGVCNFNGDDYIGLYQVVAGSPVLLDVIGIEGTDPGTSWTVAGDATGSLNHTLIRKPPIQSGNTNWLVSAGTSPADSEWMIQAQDYTSDLGQHTLDTGVPVIVNLAHAPLQPTSADPVTVTADVTDNGTLTAVNLVYTVDGGAAQTLAMTPGTPPSYAGVIPAQADLAEVAYHVEATDDQSHTTISGTGSYTVHDGFPCADIATIRANDANGSPVLMGQVRSVCGVVTLSNQLGTNGPIYITHATGSVACYGAGFLAGVSIGDEIQATGTVGFFNGLTELITPTFLNIVGHPGELTPVNTDLATLNAGGEAWEAQLVTVAGLELDPAAVWPPAGSNGTVTVLQGAESFTMFIDRDTDIDGSTAPSGTFDLVAVIGQYDQSAPYDAGYQLIPRSLADFTFVGNQPPSIGAVAHSPYVPDNTETVTVTATVVDDVALSWVNLHYQVNGGGFATTPMSVVSGDTWGGSIPAQADGAAVDYYVEAADDLNEINSSATYSYTVYATFPCADIATLHVNDAVGQPVLLGTTQYLCGVLTCADELGLGGPFYLQHATGSMALYGGALNTSTAVIGDEVEVVGVVGFYNGLTEVVNVANLTVTGHPGEPAALLTTIAALNAAGESFESQFIRLEACTLVDPLQWPAPGINGDVVIAQGVDTFTLHIDRDTDVDELPAPAGPFHVQGLAGQYDTLTPWDTGYQLTPRMATDITLVLPLDAPVVSIAYANPNVTLSWPAVAGATDYVVYTSTTNGYAGWNAGVATGGATSLMLPATGKAYFKVVAVN